MDTFAVFGIYINEENKILVTTRDDGNVGLPGGKVDPGEKELPALTRECMEEGVELYLKISFVYMDMVEGKLCKWFEIEECKLLEDYKEKDRGIVAKFITLEEFKQYPTYKAYKNDLALETYFLSKVK